MNNIRVAKFGGSSVADAEAVRRVANIVRGDDSCRVVVVSAPGKCLAYPWKVTDKLITCAEASAKHADFNLAKFVWAEVVRRYHEIIDGLGTEMLRAVYMDIWQWHEDLYTNAHLLISRGEYMMAKVLSGYLGFTFVDTADCIFFAADGTVDTNRTYEAICTICSNPKVRYVVPGFYGTDVHGKIRTFDRGGSDITGSLFAAALCANQYDNWTDVSGVFTADPSVCTGAQCIPELSLRELRELSLGGAGVFQHDAILPVFQADIPVVVHNTRRPQDAGTRIVRVRQYYSGTPVGVACRSGFTLLSLHKFNMNAEVGFGQKVLSVLARHGVSFDHSPTGTDDMSVAFRSEYISPDMQPQILSELREAVCCSDIRWVPDMALLAVVGEQMSMGKVGEMLFRALGNTPVLFTTWSGGASIIVGLPESELATVMQRVHRLFFG